MPKSWIEYLIDWSRSLIETKQTFQHDGKSNYAAQDDEITKKKDLCENYFIPFFKSFDPNFWNEKSVWGESLWISLFN